MSLRSLLPFDKFKLHTKLTIGEVQTRLAVNIEPRRVSRLFSNKPSKAYEGEFLNTSFEISRVINYRNSFLPVIKGEIASYLDKTEIAIKMRPVKIVLLFMGFWLGVVGLLCLGLLVAAITHFRQLLHEFSPAATIPFVMFGFGFALVTLGYRLEAQKSRAFLKKLLEAEESD